LLVSGSLRAASTNTALLRAAAACAPEGVEASLYEQMARLPHFNPDDDAEGAVIAPAVTDLRSAVSAADALLVSTPEYAGALPGAFKNLLEWTVGDAGLYGKPVAWLNAAAASAPTGGADAHDSLRKVLGYVGAEIVEQACAHIGVPRATLDSEGLIADAAIRERAASALDALAAHLRGR
jgi:chromate reductase, NAD(P)H dehydrogenase (quinone)